MSEESSSSAGSSSASATSSDSDFVALDHLQRRDHPAEEVLRAKNRAQVHHRQLREIEEELVESEPLGKGLGARPVDGDGECVDVREGERVLLKVVAYDPILQLGYPLLGEVVKAVEEGCLLFVQRLLMRVEDEDRAGSFEERDSGPAVRGRAVTLRVQPPAERQGGGGGGDQDRFVTLPLAVVASAHVDAQVGDEVVMRNDVVLERRGWIGRSLHAVLQSLDAFAKTVSGSAGGGGRTVIVADSQAGDLPPHAGAVSADGPRQQHRQKRMPVCTLRAIFPDRVEVELARDSRGEERRLVALPPGYLVLAPTAGLVPAPPCFLPGEVVFVRATPGCDLGGDVAWRAFERLRRRARQGCRIEVAEVYGGGRQEVGKDECAEYVESRDGEYKELGPRATLRCVLAREDEGDTDCCADTSSALSNTVLADEEVSDSVEDIPVACLAPRAGTPADWFGIGGARRWGASDAARRTPSAGGVMLRDVVFDERRWAAVARLAELVRKRNDCQLRFRRRIVAPSASPETRVLSSTANAAAKLVEVEFIPGVLSEAGRPAARQDHVGRPNPELFILPCEYVLPAMEDVDRKNEQKSVEHERFFRPHAGVVLRDVVASGDWQVRKLARAVAKGGHLRVSGQREEGGAKGGGEVSPTVLVDLVAANGLTIVKKGLHLPRNCLAPVRALTSEDSCQRKQELLTAEQVKRLRSSSSAAVENGPAGAEQPLGEDLLRQRNSLSEGYGRLLEEETPKTAEFAKRTSGSAPGILADSAFLPNQNRLSQEERKQHVLESVAEVVESGPPPAPSAKRWKKRRERLLKTEQPSGAGALGTGALVHVDRLEQAHSELAQVGGGFRTGICLDLWHSCRCHRNSTGASGEDNFGFWKK